MGLLAKIILKLGFHQRWVELVMLCISTVSYAICINGVPQGHITPFRGLRQGDPLSPYLFLICVEGLSALLHQAVHDKVLRGVSACQKGPKISHLFFVGDCLIFGWATIKKSEKILRLLKVYGELSSQQLNKQKTSLFFSRNTDRRIQEAIKGRFGDQVIKQHETYLAVLAQGLGLRPHNK